MTTPLSPDGHFYLAAAHGLPVPSPYHRRWLLPRALGPHPSRWATLTRVSLLATPPAAAAYFAAAPGLRGWRLAAAVALLSALQGVWRLPLRFPVLLDAPSFVLALLTAAVAASPWPWASVAPALVLGAIREPAPLFAALWAWHPAPLVGLLASGWWRRAAPAPAGVPWLTHPVQAALELRRAVGWDWTLYLRPWGPAVVGLAAPSWQLAVTVVVAHLQLLAAQDTVRLVVWAAPVLVASAVGVLPLAWLGVAVVMGLCVPREERA